MSLDPELALQDYCYLTTTGRVTGRLHEIEIWFALEGGTLYMLAGARERSDWVRNAGKQPNVSVRIGERTFRGRARSVDDPSEDAKVRELLLAKYRPGYAGDLGDWGRTALPVAIDLDLAEG